MKCLQFHILPYFCILRGVQIGSLTFRHLTFSMTMWYFAAFHCLDSLGPAFSFIFHVLFYVHVSQSPYLIRQCCAIFIFVFEVMFL